MTKVLIMAVGCVVGTMLLTLSFANAPAWAQFSIAAGICFGVVSVVGEL